MAAVYEDDGDFDFVVDEEEDVDFIVSPVPAKTKKQSATTNAGKGAAKGGAQPPKKSVRGKRGKKKNAGTPVNLKTYRFLILIYEHRVRHF